MSERAHRPGPLGSGLRHRRALGAPGIARRIGRPFVVLGMMVGLLVGASISMALATEFMSSQENELVALVNTERVSRGLQTLDVTPELRTIARRQSQRMMLEGTIFHSDSLAAEADVAFPQWSRLGENVGVAPSVPAVHQAYMDSPGHRANVLEPAYEYVGIGIVAGGRRQFSTENFLTLRPGASVQTEATPTAPTTPTVRVSGSDRYATAGALADYAFAAGTASAVVVADGRDWHGALAGASLAGQYHGPIALTTAPTLLPAAQAIIDRVGSPTAQQLPIGVNVLGLRVASIATTDHVGTAADVARQLSPRPTEAFVTTVENYPDALAASAISAAVGIPVLYTSPSRLSPDTADVIVELGIRSVHVVGLEGAVSAAVSAQLSALPGVSVDRIGGADRYATAAALADMAVSRGMTPARVLVATGTNFPDALAAGPAAASLGSPILLTPGNSVAAATAAWLSSHARDIDELHVVGGTAAISNAVEQSLSTLATP